MYIDIVPNRNSRPTILLREAWRDGNKIRKRTIANLTGWPEERVDALRHLLKGERLVRETEAIAIERSVSCGHVRAILQIAEKTDLPSFISREPSCNRDMIIALIVEELLHQRAPNLAVGVWQTTSLADDVGLRDITEKNYLKSLEWIGGQASRLSTLIHIDFQSMNTPDHDQTRHIITVLSSHLGRHLQSALSPLLSSYEDHNELMTTNWNNHLKRVFKQEEMSLQGLLGHLATQCLNQCRVTSVPGCPPYYLLTKPTPLQKRVHELIDEYENTFRMEPSAWASFVKQPQQRPGEKPFFPAAYPEIPDN
jgi:hypothetical protein